MLPDSLRSTVIKVSAAAFGSALAIAGIGVAGALGSDTSTTPVSLAGAHRAETPVGAESTPDVVEATGTDVEALDAVETEAPEPAEVEHATQSTPAGPCADEVEADHDDDEGQAEVENDCDEDDDAPGAASADDENDDAEVEHAEKADADHKAGRAQKHADDDESEAADED